MWICSVLLLSAVTEIISDEAKQRNWGGYRQDDYREIARSVVSSAIRERSGLQQLCEQRHLPKSNRDVRMYEDGESNEFLVRFFCKKPAGVVYAQVTLNSELRFKKLLKASTDASTFGLVDVEKDYKKYPQGSANLKEKLLEEVRSQIDGFKTSWNRGLNETDGCERASFETEDVLEEKEENGIKYYKFRVSCDYKGPASHYLEVEVACDEKMKDWHNGKTMLVGVSNIMVNSAYPGRGFRV